MKPKFFSTPEKFRDWLKKKHSKKKELIVGFYKKDSGKKSITWPESVDQTFCFGWIDGIRRSLDEISYSIQFTPRNPRSNWSEINLSKIKELKKKNLLEPAGEKVFKIRSDKAQ